MALDIGIQELTAKKIGEDPRSKNGHGVKTETTDDIGANRVSQTTKDGKSYFCKLCVDNTPRTAALPERRPAVHVAGMVTTLGTTPAPTTAKTEAREVPGEASDAAMDGD